MLTYKLKLSAKLSVLDKKNIQNYQKKYSFLYRKLHANIELMADDTFKKELQEKFGLDSWFFESCKNDVFAKIEQQQTWEEKRLKRIQNIEKELENNIFTTKKQKRRKYYLLKNLAYLKSRKDKKIVFGGLSTLQKISYLSNNKAENEKILQEEKQIFQQNRILPIYSIGETPQKSNRKFSFDFLQKKVIFKPNKNTKISLEFHCSKGQHKNLKKMQDLVGKMPFSVRLSDEYLWITFDEEKLNNFEFKESEYYAELKKIPKENKAERKEIYKKYLLEQKERKLEGKNENRYLAVDLNPEFIGFCVVEKLPENTKNHENNGFKIVHKGCVSLENLNTRKRLSSTDKRQIKQNNKRKFEISKAWQYIFRLAIHYKVANFVCEELSFEQENHNENSNIANHKTKNIWHKSLTTNLITKYCNSLGIEKTEVISAFSSFVGDVQYSEFDPIASSLEIARRGIVRYLKGSSIFPPFSNKDKDTMCQIFGLDVPCDTLLNWKQCFERFRTSELRYRRILDKTKILDKNLHSYKSCIKVYTVV